MADGIPKYKVCVFSTIYSLLHVLTEVSSNESWFNLYFHIHHFFDLFSHKYITCFTPSLLIRLDLFKILPEFENMHEKNRTSFGFIPLLQLIYLLLPRTIFNNPLWTKKVNNSIPNTHIYPAYSKSESMNPFQYRNHLHSLHLFMTSYLY